MNKTYKLLKDVENPEYDKRCKYGYKQHQTFKAGIFFEGRPASLDDKQRFEPAFAYCKEWRHLYGDLAALIIGSSVEAEPTNWHELATALGGYHHHAGDVLEQLLKDKIISMEQAKDALTKSLED